MRCIDVYNRPASGDEERKNSNRSEQHRHTPPHQYYPLFISLDRFHGVGTFGKRKKKEVKAEKKGGYNRRAASHVTLYTSIAALRAAVYIYTRPYRESGRCIFLSLLNFMCHIPPLFSLSFSLKLLSILDMVINVKPVSL
jgi:hypothetical protein